MPIAEGFVQQAHSHPEKPAVFVRANTQSWISYCYGDLLSAAQQVAGSIAPFTQAPFTQAPFTQKVDLAQPGFVGSSQESQPLQHSCKVLAEDLASPPLHNFLCVGLLLPNCIEFLEIFLGVVMAGGVAIVLDPKWTLTQICQVLQHYPIGLLLVDALLLPDSAEWAKPTDTISSTSNTSIIVLQPPFWGKNGEDWSVLESLDDQAQVDYTQWKNSHSKHSIPTGPIAESDPFYVGFTSGTTGSPKGVIRSHRSWLSSFVASQIEFGIGATDRSLVPGSLVHSLSLYAALECLNAGATLYLLSQFSASAALDCLQTQDITMLTAVPTLLQTIAKAATRRQQTCSSLRVVIAGGSKLQPDLRTELPQVFPQADILEYFGALELSFISLASSRQSVPPGSVGRSFQGVRVSIRRQDNAGEAAVGEIGWIGVKSPMVSLGYFNSKEEAGYRLIDGWATVGDLGWRDAEGYLYLIGREQEMLVSGGVNVYPTEIEAILRSFPEIEEAAVFGLPDTDRGQAIAAAILWAGTPLTRSELQRRLQTTLPRPKLPRYFFTVDRFPRTHSGKIIRTALPAQVLSQPSLTERST